MRAPLLEAAALEATEAAVVATSRATWVAEVVEVVVVAAPEAVFTSSAQDSPMESSFLRRLPAVKKTEH